MDCHVLDELEKRNQGRRTKHGSVRVRSTTGENAFCGAESTHRRGHRPAVPFFPKNMSHKTNMVVELAALARLSAMISCMQLRAR